MKWAIITINVVAAIGFLFLGALALAIHRVHSYSMYREFVSVGAVNEQQLKTLPQPAGLPPAPYYNMPGRMRQIGNAEGWFSTISRLAAIACLCNAAGVFFLGRRGAQHAA